MIRYRHVGLIVLVAVGGWLLVACEVSCEMTGTCPQTVAPTLPGPTVAPTAPPYTPPAPVTPTPQPGALAFEVRWDATTTPEADGADSLESTAILILKDRSKSMEELCRDGLTKTTLREIPEFLYAYLARDSYLEGTDIFLGIGAFPNIDHNPDGTEDANDSLDPYLSDYSLRTVSEMSELDTSGSVYWLERIGEVWEGETKDGQVLLDTIEKSVTALVETHAANKHLVIIGDSLLDYNGQSEWGALLGMADDSRSPDPLTRLLSDNAVYLHYVLPDCLPQLGRNLVAPEELLENLKEWNRISGYDLESAAPFTEGKYVKVYGHEELVLHFVKSDSSPPLSLEGKIQQLIGNLIPSYLPPLTSGELVHQSRALILPGEGADTFSLPVPGYAEAVNVQVISLDRNLQLEAPERATASASPLSDPQLPYITTYRIDLTSPLEDCKDWRLVFGRSPDVLTIVSWEIVSSDLTSVSGTLRNDVDPTMPGAQILSSTHVEGTLSRDSISFDGDSDFLDCYSFAVRSEGDDVAPTLVEWHSEADFSVPYDPQQVKDNQFTLDLEVLKFRSLGSPDEPEAPDSEVSDRLFITDASGRTFEPIGPAVAIILEDTEGSPDATFKFQPDLLTSAKECSEGGEDDRCELRIEVQFLNREFYLGKYPLSPSPSFYLLADKKTDQCKDANPPSRLFRKLDDGSGWFALDLGNDLSEIAEIRLPTPETPAFVLAFDNTRANQCDYTYLVAHWAGEPEWNQIECQLADGDCSQNAQFEYYDFGSE